MKTFLSRSLTGHLVYRLTSSVDMDDSISTTIEYMRTESHIWSNGGTFTIVHTLLPHKP